MLVQGKQQSVTAVQPCAIQVVTNLADIGLGKVVAFERFANLGKAGDLIGSQIVVDKYFHGRKDRKSSAALREFFQLNEADSGGCSQRADQAKLNPGASPAKPSQWLPKADDQAGFFLPTIRTNACST